MHRVIHAILSQRIVLNIRADAARAPFQAYVVEDNTGSYPLSDMQFTEPILDSTMVEHTGQSALQNSC